MRSIGTADTISVASPCQLPAHPGGSSFRQALKNQIAEAHLRPELHRADIGVVDPDMESGFSASFSPKSDVLSIRTDGFC
jgi:hypothetical protein